VGGFQLTSYNKLLESKFSKCMNKVNVIYCHVCSYISNALWLIPFHRNMLMPSIPYYNESCDLTTLTTGARYLEHRSVCDTLRTLHGYSSHSKTARKREGQFTLHWSGKIFVNTECRSDNYSEREIQNFKLSVDYSLPLTSLVLFIACCNFR
jgi:hypothetical protein